MVLNNAGFVAQRLQKLEELLAAVALYKYLPSAGNFNISTIDSFFQTVLRTFAREANLTGNYDVDLDDENAIIVGVDSMLSSINRATAEEMSGNRRIRFLYGF